MRLKSVKLAAAVFAVLMALMPAAAHAEETVKEGILGEYAAKPLVLYYSRTGHTKIVADAISRMLLCPQEEIISKKSRQYLGVLNCVADQLFGFDDRMEPLRHTVQDYAPLVIASPVWMHKLASPVRTVIKKAGLKDRDVYVFVTHRGNYGAADAQAITTWLERQGALVKGLYALQTENLPAEQITRETELLVKSIYW
jgi:flavodoxin